MFRGVNRFVSSRLFAALALAYFGFVPSALAQSPSIYTPAPTKCDCYCASPNGAVKTGSVKDAAACDLACTGKGYPKMSTCAKSAADVPANLPKCFSDTKACELSCAGPPIPNRPASGFIFDTNYQPPECPKGYRYCYCTGTGYKLEIPIAGTVQVNDVGAYVQTVYRYLLGISITVAIVMVMIGGLKYLLAAGGGDTKTAKTQIKNAAVGLVLLFGAALILQSVNPRLLTLQPPRLPSVKRIEIIEPGTDCASLVQKGYTLAGKPTKGTSCGSKDIVMSDKFNNPVPDGTSCVYKTCPTGQGCFVSGDVGTCLSCGEVTSKNAALGVVPSPNVCGQLVESVRSTRSETEHPYCFWTRHPYAMLGTIGGWLANQVIPSPDTVAGQLLINKDYLSGTCAALDVVCASVSPLSCEGYNQLKITNAMVGSQELSDISPGWGDQDMRTVCLSDPCQMAKGKGPCAYDAAQNKCLTQGTGSP